MSNGENPTTGTVHAAVARGEQIVQACGAARGQVAYLEPTSKPVTCRKCSAAKPVTVKTAKPAPVRYGRFEYTATDVRQTAKMLGITVGKRDLAEVFAEILTVAPQHG